MLSGSEEGAVKIEEPTGRKNDANQRGPFSKEGTGSQDGDGARRGLSASAPRLCRLPSCHSKAP